MVKHLHHLLTFAKLVVLVPLLVIIWGAIWLQSGEHTLGFAKPWIERALNPEGVPYSITFDELTIDWRSTIEFGELRMSHVTMAKRDGTVFAQFPEVNATVDPIGFLPHRSMLHALILHAPHLFMTRAADGTLRVGLEDAASSFALSELLAAFQSAAPEDPDAPIRLPFRDFEIDHATIRFHDDTAAADIISQDVSFELGRRRGRYKATLGMPFTYDGQTGLLSATLAPTQSRKDYLVDMSVFQFPVKLVCLLGECPPNVALDGVVNGMFRVGLSPSGNVQTLWGRLSTDDALLTAPQWFPKPLKFKSGSTAALGYDLRTKHLAASEINLVFADTTITGDADADRKDDGWYGEAKGEVGTKLDVTKLVLYWPISLAPDTREWVTSKLKSGHATGKATIHITPHLIETGDLTDEALEADVTARDVTVDYLPGFPHLNHVDGDIHFTGTTVRINGSGGSMLSGMKVSKSVIWCPDLMNPRNPMEVTLVADVPASDLATLLRLKHFSFDDTLGLDPAKATGMFSTTMELKFDSFSEHPSKNSNDINFDAVKYSIKAHIENFSQTGLAGGYDVKALNGELTAGMNSEQFTGSLMVGASGLNQVKLAHESGKELTLSVKGEPGPSKTANDFTLSYLDAKDMPRIKISGHGLDASVRYGKAKNSLLADFPAMALDLTLDEVVLTQGLPFTAVKGSLRCTSARCESAHFSTERGRAHVQADILRENGVRSFLLTASDAGEFLKGLDITDRMTRGKLNLRGTYDDGKAPPAFNGRLLITDFTLKNSQILGRILSIGSLTGLANALTGSGISFDKMTANIAQRAGIVTLDKGRASGTAMGITVEGAVNTNNTKLDLKGVVVPAYALNSIIGRIPLIGAIAGGEGEGIFAFNYSVTGTYDNANVSVNPLSALTPGFLRGIFGVFDRAEEDIEDATPAPADSTPALIDRNAGRP